MKTSNQLTAIKLASILVTAFAVTSGNSIAAPGNGNGNSDKKIPAAPVGWLNAYPTVVQTGTKPQLSWSTTYPSQVLDYVDVVAPATIKLKKALDVQVRVLGNGVTASSNNKTFTWVDAEAVLSFKGGSYSRVFYGKNTQVNPSTVVWSKTKTQTQANDTIRFGGRYYYNGWGSLHTSSSGGMNVRTLVNGDTPPTVTPMYQAPSLEEFIKPYLDAQGKVKIGPMDVIVFMELTHTQQNDPGYDLQDMVLLVTFTDNKPKNNNGHGNNVDGIDSSNPGNAKFMQYDSNPNVDDEN